MEDVTMNNGTVTMSSTDLNITVTPENNIVLNRIYSVKSIVTYIVICIGLPLTLVAIRSVYSMVRGDHAAPIYVINLLISDLFQLILLIMLESAPDHWKSINIIYAHETAVLASIGFMVFLALERYMLIAHPLWYRFKQSTKMSVMVCVVVWVCSIVVFLSVGTTVVGFLLPMPLFIFLLIGTVRALSSSVSVPFNEKCRIVIILVLVFMIYTLLFLPWVLVYLPLPLYIYELSTILLRLSPLADLVLYVFIRKGTAEKLLTSLCCYRRERNITITTVSGRDRSFT